MPTSNYFTDDGPEIFLPPYEDEEDYAPPPSLNGGRVWQNPRTAGVITPQELSPIPGSVSPGVVTTPPPPGALPAGIDAGMEDMMQSDVPPGALPAMQRMAGGAGAGPSSGPPMPPGPDYGKLEQIYRDYPQLTKPKWYQRLGGAAVGFGAGWSNAASRTKHPIDIAAAEHNILHPGYDDEVAQWQAHAMPEEKIAGLEGSRQQAWWKNQELQARADMEKQHGAYWAHRAQVEQNQWKIDPKSGVIYNTITGERSARPETAQDRFDVAIALGSTKDEARRYALQEKGSAASDFTNVPPGSSVYDRANNKVVYTNPNRPVKETDPLVEQLRQGQLNAQQDRATDTVSNAKASDEDKIFKERQTEVAKLVAIAGVNTEKELWNDATSAEQLKQINRKYAPRLQNVQTRYEAGVERNGGTPDRYTVNPDTLEFVPRGGSAAAPHGAAAPTYTEAEVRRRAVLAGRDPEAAVKAARQSKLIP